MELTTETSPEALIEHGKRQVIQKDIKGIPVFVIPNDMKVVELNELIEKQLPRPYTLKQNVELLTEESFIEYFKRYATESSTIFVDDQTSTFTAVLDYHDSPTEPAFKRHIATYKCPQTKEWSSWIKHNNDKFSQEDFALFIEDNLKEIVEPNGADMMQIAATLKAKNNVDFSSGIRLDNGEVQFSYTEKITGLAGVQGQLEIPEKIKLIIAPFLKGPAYNIEARFRYRVAQGGLTLWYSLIRPYACVDDAFSDVCEKIKTGIAERGHLIHAKPPV
jgi:uncharacterized protein YfdQ (DUF2303 family)